MCGVYVAYKYIALLLLVVETTSTLFATRLSRTEHVTTRYLSTTSVVMSEIMKIVFSVVFLAFERDGIKDLMGHIYDNIVVHNREFMLMAIPAGMYTLQNNLLMVALSHLDAATYQTTYQLKILTAAVFTVVLLGRVIDTMQWSALVLLTLGVALVQLPNSMTGGERQTSPVGLVSVLVACVLSGFASVYFEKLLKSSRTSLWVRNIQLGLFSAAIGLAGVYYYDGESVAKDGFFQGYNMLTWTVVFLRGAAGLIIAAVIKYADTIVKNFASSLSILVAACISGMVFNDFDFTMNFALGASLVIAATFLYNTPTPIPVPAQTPPKPLPLLGP